MAGKEEEKKGQDSEGRRGKGLKDLFGCDVTGLSRSRRLKRSGKTVFLTATVYNALLIWTTDFLSTLSMVCRGETGTALF